MQNNATRNPDVPVTRSSPAMPPRRYRWRVVDIVTASVLGVAAGLVFWVWDYASNAFSGLEAVLPGVQGILNGPWLFAGVLGALIIRKPGAALYTELLASFVSALLPNGYGVFPVLLSGLTQGLGAEILVAVLLYRTWSWWAAALYGAGAGIGEAVTDLIVSYPGAKASFAVTYAVSTTVSGIVIAGLGSWLIVRALAASGALSRFAAGRERTARV